MKKLCLLAIALCTVCAAHAQTEFSVPDLTLQEKYDGIKILMNRNFSGFFVVAKAEGGSAEELGRKMGKLYAPLWDKSTTFEDFVGFNLWAWATSTDEVKILEQSPDKVVVLVPSLDKELEESPIMEGFSIEDLVAFYNGMMQEVATHLGFKITQSWGEQGMTAVISK